jgi:Tfp pilus assembly protein PilV
MPKDLENKNGFSIIEALISLFIIGMVLILYGVSSNTLQLNSNARHLEMAQRAALTELETLQATDIASLPASGPFTSTLISSLPSGQGTISISDYNAVTKQMIVTVTWIEPSGRITRTVTFTALKIENGL